MTVKLSNARDFTKKLLIIWQQRITTVKSCKHYPQTLPLFSDPLTVFCQQRLQESNEIESCANGRPER